MTGHRFDFRFAPAYRLPALVFGVTPATAGVYVDLRELHVRFGPWRMRTPRHNVAGTELSGDFGLLRTAGPPHLSFTDHGVTCATNGDRAVCVLFHSPVKLLDPTGTLRHPGLTVTVAEPEALAAVLSAGAQ